MEGVNITIYSKILVDELKMQVVLRFHHRAETFHESSRFRFGLRIEVLPLGLFILRDDRDLHLYLLVLRHYQSRHSCQFLQGKSLFLPPFSIVIVQKSYEIRPKRTLPQALLISGFIISFVILSLSAQMMTLSPQYTTFGSQKYNDEFCSLDNVSRMTNSCRMSDVSTFFNR